MKKIIKFKFSVNRRLVILQLQLFLSGSFSLLLQFIAAPLRTESVPPPVPLIHDSPVIRQLNIFRVKKAKIIFNLHLFNHHELLLGVGFLEITF